MQICFEYSPLKQTDAAAINGQKFGLIVHRRDASGPTYPHVWEQTDPKTYAFFAGRIAGVTNRDGFPTGHAVTRRDAADWKMEPEPDGSWLAVKFDGVRDIVSFAADFCLLQRWYYTQHGAAWFVANSLRYLKELLGSSLRVNASAVPYMLIRGYLPQDQTPLADVRVLQSCRVLTIENGAGRVDRRLDPVYYYHESRMIDLPQAAREIHRVLRDAVAAEVAGLDEVCIPLSGGIDSRFLLGCAMELLPKEKITTITFGLPNSLDYKIGSGLAKQLGVRSIHLPFDKRPIAELLRDSFQTVEGAYWCVPTHPILGLREAFQAFPFILSGYIGDLVFGSYDLPPEQAAKLEQSDQDYLKQIHEIMDTVDLDEALALLAEQAADPLRTDQIYAGYQANSRENAYAMWLWEDHLFNRTNFAVELHRDLTFYGAPFVHQQVITMAYRLPKALRLEQKAYLEALRFAYPELWKYPTKNNYGFSPQNNNVLRSHAARTFRRCMADIDNLLGALTGKIYYYHPRDNYEHPRELLQERHRAEVLAVLKRLSERDTFRSAGMADLIDRYERRKPISKYVLYGLLTIDLWYEQYEG